MLLISELCDNARVNTRIAELGVAFQHCEFFLSTFFKNFF